MPSLNDLSRSPPARGLGVVLRTAHLAAMAVLVGGAVLGSAAPALRSWQLATVATGLPLLVIEASHSRNWIHQGRGVLALLHVVAVGLVGLSATAGRTALFAALVIGAVGSHLPRSLRKWSFRDRRVVD